ncbi:MAG TPA: hypothetical protein VHC18_04970 [Amycolatopsis sp.]|nr:hypothetical protein [Amycolatopsis sp.]
MSSGEHSTNRKCPDRLLSTPSSISQVRVAASVAGSCTTTDLGSRSTRDPHPQPVSRVAEPVARLARPAIGASAAVQRNNVPEPGSPATTISDRGSLVMRPMSQAVATLSKVIVTFK